MHHVTEGIVCAQDKQLMKESIWVVVDILKKRKKADTDKWEYLVKWQAPHEPSWQPEENLEGCRDLLTKFNTQAGAKGMRGRK